MVRNQKRPKDWSKAPSAYLNVEEYEKEMMKDKRREMWSKRHEEEVTVEVEKKTKTVKPIIVQEEAESSEGEIENPQLSRHERQELGKQRTQALYETYLANLVSEKQQPSELARLELTKHKRDVAEKRRELRKQKMVEAAARKAARK